MSDTAHTLEALLARIKAHGDNELFPGADHEVFFACDECEDKHWVRCEVKGEVPPGMPNHYMRECSQCLPDRYRIMVTEDHGRPEHRAGGGCAMCRRYVQPWTNVGGKG